MTERLDGSFASNQNLEYESVYTAYYGRVLRYVASRIGSWTDAADIAQEVFADCLAGLDRYDPSRAQIGTWIFAITKNKLKSYYRTHASAPKTIPIDNLIDMGEEPLADDKLVDEAALIEEAKRLLIDILADLSDKERQIVTGKYFDEKTSQQIADELGLSAVNVRVLLSRTLDKIRLGFKLHGYLK